MRLGFLEQCSRRVLVFDGAMGTSIHSYPLDLQRDYLGLENCSEILVQTRPDIIRAIHESFLAVGCDAVETDTFGANKVVLAEFGLSDQTFDLNKRAALIAREACAKFHSDDQPRFVIGSIGPGTKLPTLGHASFDVLEDSYAEQCRGLIAGGADALLFETCQDLLQTKAALGGASIAMAEANTSVPILVQVTMEVTGTMLVGSDISAVVASLLPYGQIDVLGLNCATGPAEMGEHVQFLSHHWPRLISVLPNAGLPVMVDGKAQYLLTPDAYAAAMLRFVEEYGVNIVGGCCGTTPAHLAALTRLLGNRRPAARTVAARPQVASLYEAEDIRQDNSYLIIAERTNTNGSRKFKRLVEASDWDGLVSMARDEVRDGSHVLDVCVDFVGRNGVADMAEVVGRFIKQVEAPLMLDSTDPAVMEAGLKLAGGRCILNSMNLEDGEHRVAEICSLARKYGAAVVAGTIDEDKQSAMARTADRKLAIATRIHELATGKFGLRPEDILFDPLVLPITTGIEEDRRNALETVEGIRRITQALPQCHTVVGLSNVSFGLKPDARVVLNSAFLHECREAGLTAAIVHASKILPRTKIDDARWNAALDLIYDRRREGFDPLTHFIGLFPDGQAAAEEARPTENLSVEETLKRHIIDGEKRDLTAHLDAALKQYSALDIINSILLEGMKVVGELFGSGQMQLPFVLQSAETMKSAVGHLQQFMEKLEGGSKGRIVLATVKGDVHDIGKNLVDIILTNNGYTVINLGIKQPIGAILQAARERKADAIGMSGLLVKSVGVMRENLQEMNAMDVSLPVLLGGAALTRDYAEEDLASLYRGPLLYCRDAFEGLYTMDSIMVGGLEGVLADQTNRVERRRKLRENAVKPKSADAATAGVATDNPVPRPPFWGRRVVTDIQLESIYPYVNTNALFRGQWGFKKGALSPEQFQKLTDETAMGVFRELQERAIRQKLLEPKVVYGYWPAQADGNDIVVYDPRGFEPDAAVLRSALDEPRPVARFSFPRQVGRRRLCISDFFRARASGQFDVLAVQLVTMGARASELAQELFAANKYQEYLYIHGFGVECAEGLAELWHKQVRAELGFAAEDAPLIPQLFQQSYRGSRYSFGYPACPDLEQRATIVRLLGAADIGVSLSESFMLVPEQSTDALVAHHPQAKYFDVGE